MTVHLRQRFPHHPMAPSAAREAVDNALSGQVEEGTLAEVRLLVSEVVTNAVRHGSDRDGGVDLAVAFRGGVVRIEVADGGPGFSPPDGAPDPVDSGGWGLVVVDRVADRWGVDARSGTRVWFELETDPGGGGGGGGGALAMAAIARSV